MEIWMEGPVMPLEPYQVKHIAALARIGLTDEEIDLLRHQLAHILEQFQVLEQIDTSGVNPTGHAGELNTVLREDIPGHCLSPLEVLSNAPRTQGEFIRVKPVLSDEGTAGER
jgi:aspartyl-tRNA(Asn)/glutamyl-tRNA(Gln) amidotransferase subunit C